MRFSNRGRFLPLFQARGARFLPKGFHRGSPAPPTQGRMGRRTAVRPGPLFYCLLASSLLFRRRPFSALFCSPRPSLLYGPRLPLVCGRYGTVPVTPLSTASLPPSHWSRPPVAAAWRPLRCAVSSGDFCSPSRRRSGHGAGTPSPARTPSALSPPTVCPGAPTRFRWGSGLGSTVGACCMGPPLAGTPPSALRRAALFRRRERHKGTHPPKCYNTGERAPRATHH